MEEEVKQDDIKTEENNKENNEDNNNKEPIEEDEEYKKQLEMEKEKEVNNKEDNEKTKEAEPNTPDKPPEPIRNKYKVELNSLQTLHLLSVAILIGLLYSMNLFSAIRNDVKLDCVFFKLSMVLFLGGYAGYFYNVFILKTYVIVTEEVYEKIITNSIPFIFVMIIGANVFFLSSFRYISPNDLVLIKLGVAILSVQVVTLFNWKDTKGNYIFFSFFGLLCLIGLFIKQKGFYYV